MSVIPASKTLGRILAIIGFLLALPLLSLLRFLDITIIMSFILSICIGVLGIYLIGQAKPSYVVRIGSASGESDGLVSKDSEYIQKIVDAMNKAIIQRG
jgi:hypothetical protein